MAARAVCFVGLFLPRHTPSPLSLAVDRGVSSQVSLLPGLFPRVTVESFLRAGFQEGLGLEEKEMVGSKSQSPRTFAHPPFQRADF